MNHHTKAEAMGILGSVAWLASLAALLTVVATKIPKSLQDFPKSKFRVSSLFPEASFHGYLTVNNNGDDLFYWYWPSRNNEATDPLIVWFTGGPGCSAGLALFFENGPYIIPEGQTVPVLNQYSWNTNANLLYIDQPIGVGYSHGKFSDIPQLESLVKQWFQLDRFKALQNRPMYITGESYGGHYVPCIANALFNSNLNYINIAGVGIGNGWVTASSQQVAYDTYARNNSQQLNFPDQQYFSLLPQFQLCSALIKNSPFWMTDKVINLCSPLSGIPLSFAGRRVNVYDITKNCSFPLCYNMSGINLYLNSPVVLNELQVDKPWISCNGDVNSVLSRLDSYMDYAPQLVDLLNNNKKVLIYYGMNDYICNWEGGLQWTLDLEWPGQAAYAAAEFTQYGDMGEMKQTGSFQFLKIPNAGHLVPHDLPEQALEMVNILIGASPAPEMPKSRKSPSFMKH